VSDNEMLTIPSFRVRCHEETLLPILSVEIRLAPWGTR
jgi:hypothetical protein